MEGLRRFWPWPAAFLAVLLLWAAARQRPGERRALVALDASQAAALCAASGYSAADFWERAQAIGVGAALFSEETLGDLSARGDVLSFSREELEKWKAFGLVAPGVSLKPNALWVKNPLVLSRLLGAAERTGVSASTGSAAGYQVIEFKESLDASFPAGYDAASLELAESKKLVPILGGKEALAGRVLGARAKLPAVLRAVYSHPRRLILLTLDPASGVEGNLSELRGLLKPLRLRGIALDLPQAASLGPQADLPSAWRRWLAWLLAAVGPLVALRVGLQGFKRARTCVLERWPLASPIMEIGAGFLAVVAVALGMGLATSLALGPGGVSGLPEGLAVGALAAPILVGVLALYTWDWGYWKRRWGSALTLRDAAQFALSGLLVLLLLKPRLVLSAFGLWSWAERAGEFSEPLWWWRWRWREIVVGFPALLHAFFLLERRLGCPDCPGAKKGEPLSDPRGWLLLGLIGPSGVIAAVGHPGAPLFMVLGQTAVVVALGLAAGVGLIALRGPLLSKDVVKGQKT
jgi:hypothetical protein